MVVSEKYLSGFITASSKMAATKRRVQHREPYPPVITQEANEIIYFFGLDSGGTIPLAR